MADPISIAASVITLAAAAAQISKALSRLRAFGELPEQIHSLKNEVTDLEVVLRQIGHRFQQRIVAPAIEDAPLRKMLSRTKVQLGSLADALERVATACADGKVNLIGRSFKSLHGELQAIKASFNLMLSTSNSYDLQHIMLELRNVTVLTSDREQQDALVKHPGTDLHGAMLARMEEQYREMRGRFDELDEFLREGSRMEEQLPSYSSRTSSPNRHPVMQQKGVRVLVAYREPCKGWCPCACHAKRKLASGASWMAEQFFGRMFVGYSGIPLLNRRCDFQGCRKQEPTSATMEYWFPGWVASTNLRLCFKNLPQSGPQLQISTTRRVPDTAQSIAFAMQGNIVGLQHLFTKGLASPRDVSDSRGYSLVRWALYGGMHQYQTVQYLIDAGAKVDEISYDNVWDFMLRGKVNQQEANGLRCITEGGEGDWVEEQNFPLVHRIVLGLSQKSLALEVEENPAAIYLTDAQGRSALDWATARAQHRDICILIAAGVDPNTMDITGRTTVLHAVDSHDTESLRLVLEAGGHPDPRLPKGVFRSSPLTVNGALFDFTSIVNWSNWTGRRHGLPVSVRKLRSFTKRYDIMTISFTQSALLLLAIS
ncbi:hypothetical protein KVT40_005952 [Elsinoe batatas]|uniref:Azaphilone pigments biosynthesis cluster protein L N-terminal domain-containing protein n=1 Tax=Elsinoe batatas TaxID=2601811 RepID=A0A8K0L0T6_9PEZI|nr:hypothetical protein KVT40_005952 [Elsinoe batatas]